MKKLDIYYQFKPRTAYILLYVSIIIQLSIILTLVMISAGDPQNWTSKTDTMITWALICYPLYLVASTTIRFIKNVRKVPKNFHSEPLEV